jgi:hypothetical protein
MIRFSQPGAPIGRNGAPNLHRENGISAIPSAIVWRAESLKTAGLTS